MFIKEVIRLNLTYGNALRQAIYDSLKSDETVFMMGEDIQKNLYGYTEGLLEEFGSQRVLNIPLAEAGAMGIACGAAMCGLRPIIDLTIPNFLYVAMDQIANMAAKVHYMSNGEFFLPITILCSVMSGSGNAAQHSDRVHSLFQTIPGLKIICPATPQDIYSMTREAVKDNSPVLCLADRALFWVKDEIELKVGNSISGSKRITTGSDISIIAVSSCVQMVKEILPEIKKSNISAELIDVRSVVPLDLDTILESVKKTKRVIICDTSNRSGSVASEVAAQLAQEAFYYLKEPIQIVAAENVPSPFAKVLEDEVFVTKEKILNRIKTAFHYDEEV